MGPGSGLGRDDVEQQQQQQQQQQRNDRPILGCVGARAVGKPFRIVWLAVAGASLGLGALGLVLPLLPTTPFVLVAAYAAAKGSPRLHAWIVRHRTFGPVVRDWQAGGTVAPRTKRVALATMALSAAVLSLVAPIALVAAALVVMTIVGTWLWRRPEPAPERRGAV